VARLILVRHSQVATDPAVPPKQWRLSQPGRDLCLPLAEALRPYTPEILLSSDEPKAIDTANLIANQLGLCVQIAAALDEHRRPYVAEGFLDLMQHLFQAPDERVFGEESAVEATVRFGTAVDAAVKVNTGSTLAIVTHGTVLALHAAPLFGVEPYFLWTRMSHPSFVVLDPDARAGVAVVESVA
jgi:2,3-bisphosphoglycerate-dependent phosphoglycerate mutase